MNKDQVKGSLRSAAGKVQKSVGKATGNKSQEVKGHGNQVAGAGQKKFGDLKENIKDTTKSQH